MYISLYWKNGANSFGAEVHPPGPGIVDSMSYDGANDPDSGISHAIYELSIPMQNFVKNSAIRAVVWDAAKGGNFQWPMYQGPAFSMAYFGDIVLSELVVPELALPAIVLLLSLVLTYPVVKRGNHGVRTRREQTDWSS